MSDKMTELLEIIVKASDDKRSVDIVALDMSNISIVTDYNVITHGNSERQIGAIAQGIADAGQEAGHELKRIEGKGSSNWVLIDFGGVVAHVFSQDEREFYQLEDLWAEAATVDISDWI